jgi:hypothetical protein
MPHCQTIFWQRSKVTLKAQGPPLGVSENANEVFG